MARDSRENRAVWGQMNGRATPWMWSCAPGTGGWLQGQAPEAAAIPFGFRAFPAVFGQITHMDRKEGAGVGWEGLMEGDFKARQGLSLRGLS